MISGRDMSGVPEFARPQLEQEYAPRLGQREADRAERQDAAAGRAARSTSVPAYAAAVLFVLACGPRPAASPVADPPSASRGAVVITCQRVGDLKRCIDTEHGVACYYAEAWGGYGGGPALSCVRIAQLPLAWPGRTDVLGTGPNPKRTSSMSRGARAPEERGERLEQRNTEDEPGAVAIGGAGPSVGGR